MALANELGIVTSLPGEDNPGTIELEREGLVVHFIDDSVSPDFTHEVAGPFEVGTQVRVWAVKIPVHPQYVATQIHSTIEPLQGMELLLAMFAGDTSLACRKGMLDSGGNAARESLDTMLEESWVGYTTEEDEPPFGAGPIRMYPPL